MSIYLKYKKVRGPINSYLYNHKLAVLNKIRSYKKRPLKGPFFYCFALKDLKLREVLQLYLCVPTGIRHGQNGRKLQ